MFLTQKKRLMKFQKNYSLYLSLKILILDYILYVKNEQVKNIAYMDNRITRIPITGGRIPLLKTQKEHVFWGTQTDRNVYLYGGTGEYERFLKFENLGKYGFMEDVVDENVDDEKVVDENVDDEKVVDEKVVTRSMTARKARKIHDKRGKQNPFHMLNNLSDHYPVVSNIYFSPSTKNLPHPRCPIAFASAMRQKKQYPKKEEVDYALWNQTGYYGGD